MRRGRHVLALLAAAAATVGACALPAAAGAAERNQWLGMRVLNQIHQGGEDEAPSNTLFAYHDGLAKGGDMIELDVHATKDGALVAIHDDTVDRTTNGRGAVRARTLAQLRRLDAAYNFVPGENAVPGRPASAYPLRGVRTGRKAAPAGFGPEDFRIPTLGEIFSAFPNVPVNLEIKGATSAEKLRVADLLARFLKGAGRRDVIVVSFDQAAVDRFHARAPAFDTAPGVDGISGFLLGGTAPPAGTKAIQVPITYTLGGVTLEVVTPEYVAKAHRAGYAVHVWLDKSEETEAVYARLADLCVDGVMTAVPSRFQAFLEQRRSPRPGGQGGSDGCRRPTPPPPGCRVRASRFVGRDGRAWMRLQRYGSLRGDCAVRISLSTTLRVRRGSGGGRRGTARTFVLGTGRATVPAGRIAAIAPLRATRWGRGLSLGDGAPLVATVAAPRRTDVRTFRVAGTERRSSAPGRRRPR